MKIKKIKKHATFFTKKWDDCETPIVHDELFKQD